MIQAHDHINLQYINDRNMIKVEIHVVKKSEKDKRRRLIDLFLILPISKPMSTQKEKK